MVSTRVVATPLPDAGYRALVNAVLAAIEADIDRWLEADVVDIDARRTGDLLELALPGGSHLIVNAQPPLQELWLAARAGGFHFKYVDGRWIDGRDGCELFDLLSRCASEQAGLALRFTSPSY